MIEAQKLGQIVGSTLIIYIFLVLMLRFVGRRELSQLTTIDLLLIVLLGSSVETAMVNASTDFVVGIVSATTLILANFGISRLFRKFPIVRKILGGKPILIVHDGHIVENHVRRLGLTDEDVMEALREREQCKLEDIRFAVFEPDGEINVIPIDRKVHSSNVEAAPTSP